MKRALFAATILAAGWAFAQFSAKADVVDPLQGVCFTGGGCTDNGTFTAITPAQQTGGWGFRADPAQGGTLELVFLIPTDEAGAGFVLPAITGSTTQGTLHAGLFSSGSLQTYLALSGTPANPFDNLRDVSRLTDPNMNTFTVFTAIGGTFANICNCATPVDQFSLASALPGGSAILGVLSNNRVNTFTALSGQLSAQGVPGPIAGAGLPSLVMALLGMAGLNRYRKRRRTA